MPIALGLQAPTAARSRGDGLWPVPEELQHQTDPPAREKRVSLVWSGVALRDALKRFGLAHGLTIMLDRRVDPGQRLDLSFDQVRLRAALEAIAADRHLGVSLLGPVAYFGPPQATDRLRTLAAVRADDVGRLPPDRRDRFAAPSPWQWEELTTPRELFLRLGKGSGIDIRGLDLVPHDLWPATELPPLSLTDRLTLIGNGFDLTFTIAPDGRSVQLGPIWAPVVLERAYPRMRDARRLVARLGNQMPGAGWRFEADIPVLRGRVEDHELVTAFLSRPRAGPPAAADTAAPSESQRTYTLTVKNQPVGSLVRALGKKLGLDMHIDSMALHKAGCTLEKRISFEVRDVTMDELLRACLGPADLDYTRDGNVVTVAPAQR